MIYSTLVKIFANVVDVEDSAFNLATLELLVLKRKHQWPIGGKKEFTKDPLGSLKALIDFAIGHRDVGLPLYMMMGDSFQNTDEAWLTDVRIRVLRLLSALRRAGLRMGSMIRYQVFDNKKGCPWAGIKILSRRWPMSIRC